MNKDADFEQFTQSLLSVAEVFDRNLSAIAIAAYWDALKPFSIDEFVIATKRAVVECRFFPRPLDLIELAGHGQASVEHRATLAANEIISHLRQNGSGSFPPIANEDPIAGKLMTSRWDYYTWGRDVLESELKWWVKEFTEAYVALSETPGDHLLTGSNKKQLEHDGDVIDLEGVLKPV